MTDTPTIEYRWHGYISDRPFPNEPGDPGVWFPLVPCGTCEGRGRTNRCCDNLPSTCGVPCPAGCWDGWVPTDDARKAFNEYSFKRAIRATRGN